MDQARRSFLCDFVVGFRRERQIQRLERLEVNQVVSFFVSSKGDQIRDGDDDGSAKVFVLTISRECVVMIVATGVRERSNLCMLKGLLIRVCFYDRTLRIVVFRCAKIIRMISEDRVFHFFHSTICEGVVLIRGSNAYSFIGPEGYQHIRCLIIQMSKLGIHHVVVQGRVVLMGTFSFFFRP